MLSKKVHVLVFYPLLNWKMHGETMKLYIVVFLTIYICTNNLLLLFDNTTGMTHLKTQWILSVPPGLTLKSLRSTHTAYWYVLHLSYDKQWHFFYIWVSVHHKSIVYNKPTRCNSGSIVFTKNYKYALHVSDALCVHLQEHYKL